MTTLRNLVGCCLPQHRPLELLWKLPCSLVGGVDRASVFTTSCRP